MGKLLRVNMELGKCRDFVSPRGSERSGSPVLSPSRMTDADLATQEQAMKGAAVGLRGCHPRCPAHALPLLREVRNRVTPQLPEGVRRPSETLSPGFRLGRKRFRAPKDALQRLRS